MITTVRITADEERVLQCRCFLRTAVEPAEIYNWRLDQGKPLLIDTSTARESEDGVAYWTVSCAQANTLHWRCPSVPHIHRICAHFLDVD
jgi:hypothetical protein